MSEKKDISNSKKVKGESESYKDEAGFDKEERVSDSDKVENTTYKESNQGSEEHNEEETDKQMISANDQLPNLIFEKDVSNVLQRLESRTETRIIDVEDGIADEGTVLHFTSSALASQIKKIAPSINISDKPVLETKNEPSDTLFTGKNASSSNVSHKKTAQRYPVLRKISITSEVGADDLAKLCKESTQEVIDEAIKKIPIPMNQKRRRRDTLMILPKKTVWYKRLLNKLRQFSARVYKYELWHEDLKTIEGRFGVAVVSYFLFIRWLLFMNIIILLLNLIFLVLPQSLVPRSAQSTKLFNDTFTHKEYLNWTLDEFKDDDWAEKYIHTHAVKDILSETGMNKSPVNSSSPLIKIIQFCHKRYEAEYGKMKYTGFLAKIQTILDGRGWLESTLLFIGSYKTQGVSFMGFAYNVPLAFLWVFIVSFFICLVMMIRYTSFGIEEAFMSSNEATSFANEIFSAWDFCIRTPKAAALHRESIMVSLKSELFEVRSKKELKERSFETWVKLYSIRVAVNVCVLLWIAGCYVLIYNVAIYQLIEQKTKKLLSAGFRTLLIQYLPPFTVTGIAIVSRMFFNFLVSFEKYHAQTEVNISLIRNVFLSLSSIIVLINTFHKEVTCGPKDVCGAGINHDCKTPLCWETLVGQQLYKLNLSQLFVLVASFVLFDVPREFFVKNCDNKVSRMIGKATFFLPTEVLVAIYSQTVLWLGVFYSPLLPVVTCIKFIVLFYIKKTKVLQCSQKSKVLYKASRFNSTFIVVLLLSFSAVLSVHFYTLTNIRPSLGCTPFSHYNSMLLALRDAFQFLPFDIVFVFSLLLSGWCFIPCSIMLCTTIFYYRRHIDFLKNMQDNLKTELTVLGQDKKFILQRIEALAKEK